MEKLSPLRKKNLAKLLEKNPEIVCAPTDSAPVGVLQFGEGKFLRSFSLSLLNAARRKRIYHKKAVLIQPTSAGKCQLYKNQDNLFFHIYPRNRPAQKKNFIDPEGSSGSQEDESEANQTKNKNFSEEPLKNSIEKEIIWELNTSVQGCLNIYASEKKWRQFLAYSSSRDLELIVSNTTEAGLFYAKIPEPNFPEIPQSTAAQLCYALYRRYLASKTDPSVKGLTLIPMELIPDNGELLLSLLKRHARDWNYGNDFIVWLEHENIFFNSLVDRIAVSPDPKLEQMLKQKFECQDRLLTVSESFFQLYLQPLNADSSQEAAEFAKKFQQSIPLFQFNPQREPFRITFTNTLQPFAQRKLYSLNLIHLLMSTAAPWLGLGFVHEAMKAPFLNTLLQKTMEDEVLPLFRHPALFPERFENEAVSDNEEAKKNKIRSYGQKTITEIPDLENFYRESLKRMQNPLLGHSLKDIALSASAKWPLRLFPLLEAYSLPLGKNPLRAKTGALKKDPRPGYALPVRLLKFFSLYLFNIYLYHKGEAENVSIVCKEKTEFIQSCEMFTKDIDKLLHSRAPAKKLNSDSEKTNPGIPAKIESPFHEFWTRIESWQKFRYSLGRFTPEIGKNFRQLYELSLHLRKENVLGEERMKDRRDAKAKDSTKDKTGKCRDGNDPKEKKKKKEKAKQSFLLAFFSGSDELLRKEDHD